MTDGSSDGAKAAVLAAGRYIDTVDVTRPVLLFTSRTLHLQTRGIGTEAPF